MDWSKDVGLVVPWVSFVLLAVGAIVGINIRLKLHQAETKGRFDLVDVKIDAAKTENNRRFDVVERGLEKQDAKLDVLTGQMNTVAVTVSTLIALQKPDNSKHAG